MPWLTFLSDYGLEDSFVGVCKGVIARTAPDVRVIDVCHQILAQDVAQAAITLAAAVPYLPSGVHLALVDPPHHEVARGVAIATGDGSVFVAPDNGVTSLAWSQAGEVRTAHTITNRDLFLQRPSPMFRGRDVFAPVAARLAAGLAISEVGPAVDPATLVRLDWRGAVVHGDHVHGEVVAVDHFGNLALSMSRADLEAAGLTLGDDVEVRAGGRALQVPLTVSYGDVAPGRVAVCEDPYRRITIAVNQGHAARTLRAARGEPVVIGRVPRTAPTPAGPVGVLQPPPG
ncbi:MAG: SAM hydrolase/SAM-dependent halogenase family protein [Mycobacteriales bacterium]